MKKFRCLLLLLSLHTLTFSQSLMDSLAMYHPLQNGNEWVYQRKSILFPEYYHSVYFERKIVGDTIIGDYTYKKISEMNLNSLELSMNFGRFDVTNGNYYDGIHDTSSGTGIDLSLADSTAANIANTSFGSGKLVTLSIDTILGNPTSIREILELMTIDEEVHQYYAYGFGLIREEHSEFSSFYDSLIYAKIDGKEYGSNPLPLIQKHIMDSLAKYYPLQTGNEWIYQSWDGDNPHYSIKKIIGDTTINSKIFSQVEWTNYFPITTVVYERFDTSTATIHQNVDGEEFMLDSLFATEGQEFGWPFLRVYDSISFSDVFDIHTAIRFITRPIVPFPYYFRYAYRFGEIGIITSHEDPIYPRQYTSEIHLVYAKINGIEYGENPLSVQLGPNVLPTTFSLSQNYPNPFNPSTTIRYELPKSSFIKLTVYNILGKECAVLVNEKKDVGTYSVPFNASGLASGIYFYVLKAGSYSSVGKMSYIK